MILFNFILFLSLGCHESQNHSVVEVGRDLWRSSGPTHLDQARPPGAVWKWEKLSFKRLIELVFRYTGSQLGAVNFAWEGTTEAKVKNKLSNSQKERATQVEERMALHRCRGRNLLWNARNQQDEARRSCSNSDKRINQDLPPVKQARTGEIWNVINYYR